VIERLAGQPARDNSGAIAAVLAGSFDAPSQRWDARSVAGTLSLPGTVAFLAREQAAPRACALLRIVADEAEILTLAVLPEARRRGLGARLVAACLDEAAAADALRLHLEVGASNAAARALYARAGFVEAGRRPGYYRGASGGATGPDDAVLMACDIARSLARPLPALRPGDRKPGGGDIP
jgi:[ribosomal protein S18]-alanine N-acetyltransferase